MASSNSSPTPTVHDFKKLYPLQEAIALAKETHQARFDASIDLAVKLGIDPKKPLQNIRESVPLPHGTGKVPRILVLCTADQQEAAQKAGADHVGFEDYIQKIEKGWKEIDVIVTMPSLMGKIGKLGPILGPIGLFPNIKTGTITNHVANAVKEIKAGKVTIRTEKAGIIHTSVGRVSFPTEKIQENIEALVHAIKRAKHSSVKGQFIKKITLSTTMGRGISLMLHPFTN